MNDHSGKTRTKRDIIFSHIHVARSWSWEGLFEAKKPKIEAKSQNLGSGSCEGGGGLTSPYSPVTEFGIAL